MLGIIGLYLEDIHRLLKQRPHFIVAELVGREEEAPTVEPLGARHA
jgi:hypothetical protein